MVDQLPEELRALKTQMKSFINDLTIENNRLSKNEKKTTEVLREFRSKGDL